MKCLKDYKLKNGRCVNTQSFAKSLVSKSFWKTNWDLIVGYILAFPLILVTILSLLRINYDFFNSFGGIMIIGLCFSPILFIIALIRNIANKELRSNWKRWLMWGISAVIGAFFIFIILLIMAFRNFGGFW